MYIGVLDKQTGTLTVTPTAPQGIITMAPAYHSPHLDTLRTVSTVGYVATCVFALERKIYQEKAYKKKKTHARKHQQITQKDS